MIQMNIFVDWQSVKDEGRPPPGKEGKIVDNPPFPTDSPFVNRDRLGCF